MITSTQLIRQAALKTGTVVTPTPWKEPPPGKKKRKSDAEKVRVGDLTGVIMRDVKVENVADSRCWLCGGDIGGKGLPVKKAIKSTFTDRDMARCLSSSSICQGCAFCLSYMSLRNYSILATRDNLRHPSRAEIKDLLLDPPKPPFVICIAVSGQKWLHYRAQIAYDTDGYPVQFEDVSVCVWRKPLSEWLEVIERMYAVFSKDEIRTGRYSQNRIRQFGLAEFQMLEERLAPHRGSRLFDLAVFVAQKPLENKKGERKCITTSIQRTGQQQQLLF